MRISITMTTTETNTIKQAPTDREARNEAYARALEAVMTKGQSISSAAREYKVSMSALWARVQRAKGNAPGDIRGRQITRTLDLPRGGEGSASAEARRAYFAAAEERLRERDARLAKLPRTFDFNRDMLGDPAPGRSALDAIRASAPADNTSRPCELNRSAPDPFTRDLEALRSRPSPAGAGGRPTSIDG
jgi:transposase-like protein